MNFLRDKFCPPRRLRLSTGVVCLVAMIGTNSARAQTTELLLIRRATSAATEARPVQMIHLSAITDQHLEHAPPDKSAQRVPLNDCIAVLNPAISMKPRTGGLLMLADGQRLPGEVIASTQPRPDSLAWNHPWLGQMNVPLTMIEFALLTPTAALPPPGQEDVILLANGDRQEGLIVSWGATVSLESGRGAQKQTSEIPLNRITSIRMVAARSAPTGRRIWFDDGTVLDVQSINLSADGAVRLSGSTLLSSGPGTQPIQLGPAQIAAILFDAQAMTPLAALNPSRVEGPPTRYQLPKPMAINPEAPLGLSDIEISGPLVVRYSLPMGAQRFTADVELPGEARRWGNCDLIVRSDDREVFRTRLHEKNPAASINVVISGRELTIEVGEGENGPIQDRVMLRRPMLLMKSTS